MKYLFDDKNSIPHFIASGLCFLSVILLVIFSVDIKEEIISSVHSCVNVIIPCVFPMLFVSCFLTEYGLPDVIKNCAGKFTKRFFGLSGSSLEGVISGLATGYISGTKCAAILLKKNIITAEEAKRLSLFFTNPGISFTVIFFGKVLFDSVIWGIKLYFISVTVNLISAAAFNLINKNEAFCKDNKEGHQAVSSFTRACENASAAIIKICFNIIIFSVIQIVCLKLTGNSSLSVLIKLIGEVSSACLFSSESYSVYVSFFVLQFGGISIFLQSVELLKDIGIKPSVFLISRVIHSLFCTALMYILSPVVPLPVINISENTIVHFSTDSLTGILSLLLLCFVYLCTVRGMRRNISKRQ